MNRFTILMVGGDLVQLDRMSRALHRLSLPRPVHLPKGESAILWVGAHDCDLCLLDYRLPGMNGVETLVGIRQRKPNLPVIMISDAESEQVAISAFRNGVFDYVPKKAGFQEVVAELVEQVMRTKQAAATSDVQTILASVPEPLRLLTYQNRLRVIGRQLDQYGYRSINLVEVRGGFVARCLPPKSRVPEALEFSDRDYPQLMANTYATSTNAEPRYMQHLLPTGYEDFLRALGHRLDERGAEAITIAELDGLVVVGGHVRAEGYTDTVINPFHEMLRSDDIEFLLDEAFRRRAQAAISTGKGSSIGARLRRL